MPNDVVEFKQGNFHSNDAPQSLEVAVRRAACYAGVHRFDFRDTIGETFADLDDWTSDASGTFSVVAGQLNAVGGGGALWYATRHSTQVRPGFVASFDVVSGSGGFAFRMDTDALPEPYYMAWWNTTAIGISRVDGARAETILSSVPISVSAGRYQVYVRYSLDSVDEDRKWLQMALYIDGRCLVAFSDDIGDTAYDTDGDYVGFAVYSSNTLVVDNLSISELTRPVEWMSIDVGQDPGGGMGQAIGTSRVTYHCRYDNTLRVWRVDNRDADWVVPDTLSRQMRIDARGEITRGNHARVQAAIHEADAFDVSYGEAYMHRFVLHNDPNIMTGQEAYVEAHRVLHDEKELSQAFRFQMPPNYLIEPGDRVTINSVDYRVRTVATEIGISGSQVKVSQTLECQRYFAFTEPTV